MERRTPQVAPSDGGPLEASRYGTRAPRSALDLLSHPPEAPTRLMEPSLIVAGGLTVIAAPTKVGKTNFWLHVTWALTEGRPLFGRFDVPVPIPVLMIQLELSEATLAERLVLLRQQLCWSDEGLGRFGVHCQRAILLDREDGQRELTEIVQKTDPAPGFVILDSYNALVGGDPDKSGEARRALHALRVLQDRTGVALGITCEIRKPPPGQGLRYTIDDLKGSNEVAYDADTVLMFRPMDRRRTQLALRFEAMRHVVGEPPEDLVLARRGLGFEVVAAPDISEREREIQQAIRAHLEDGGKHTARACKEAVRKAGVSASTEFIEQVWRRMVREA